MSTYEEFLRERSGGICELCDRRATNMHHRRNRSQGGRWEPSNILHLCGSGTTDCHGHVTAYPLLVHQERLDGARAVAQSRRGFRLVATPRLGVPR